MDAKAYLMYSVTMPIYAFILCLFVCGSVAKAQEHFDIFVVSGQSNARATYAEGVFAALEDSEKWENPILFHRTHPGNWLSWWVSGFDGDYVANTNFISDFWNPSGTSDLQLLIREIESQGDTWDIAGLFWFQGEGDTGGTSARAQYAGRFGFILSELKARYALDHEVPFIITVIDYNPASLNELFLINRTPEMVNEIRDIQFGIADTSDWGIAFDTRGWDRIDVWHMGDLDDPNGIYAQLSLLGKKEGALFVNHFGPPVCDADFSEPFDVLDIFDLLTFLDVFNTADPSADITGEGDFNIFDVLAFLDAFNAGCP